MWIPPNQTGFPFSEADIDAVGAISSIPEPNTSALLLPVILATWYRGRSI